MKYDSNMTQYHGEIVSAIKSMIYGDVDKVAELAAEGSPVPLKDYLRERHGNRCHGGNKFGCLSSGFLVLFDHIINNDGDTKLQLSWSQTAGFIRKYPSEIFSEDEPAEDIIPDKSSLELFCNTFDESEVKCPFWRTGQTMRYLNFGGVDFKCDYCENSFCEFDKLTEFLASHCHDYKECIFYRKHKDDKSDFPCDDCGYDNHNCCSYPDTPDDYCVCGDKKIPAPAQPENTVPAGKYTEAVQLNAQIITSARAAQQNLYDMAMGFKKMRDDKLYKELGYDTFEAYCKAETGMVRKNVYNYISIVENLPADFVTSKLQIGKEKLYLLSTIDEEHRTEIIENTDLESTTVKELREQIEQLKESEAKTKSQLEEAEEHNAVLSAEKEQFHRASKANLEKLNEERNRNADLEQQIKELESRPRDVAFDVNELNRRVAEVSVKLQNQADQVIAEGRRDLFEKIDRLEDERDRLENRIAELESGASDSAEKDKEIAELKQRIERMENGSVKSYVIRLTDRELVRLRDIVQNSGDSAVISAVKSARIIKI